MKCFENEDYLRCKLRLEEIYEIKANDAKIRSKYDYLTNTPRGFHVETIRKRPFPCRFNVESTWYVFRAACSMMF